jgi:SAM-dependent methyltransferase
VFADRRRVLEIGSGTGQHAAYFAPDLPHLAWQTSDVAAQLPGIREWVSDPPPLELDVARPFPPVSADAVFTANTCHIVSWPQVEKMFAGVAALLPPSGVFALYGPFHYGGRATSPSNAEFDAWLRARDPASGVRDFEAVRELARRHGLELEEDNAMPANNRLLIFRKRP